MRIGMNISKLIPAMMVAGVAGGGLLMAAQPATPQVQAKAGTTTVATTVVGTAEPSAAPLPEVGFGGYEVLRSGDDWSVEVEVQVLNGIAPVEDLKNLTRGVSSGNIAYVGVSSPAGLRQVLIRE